MNAVSFFVVGLQIGFILMRIPGVITWSWWWVLSPMWISFIPWVINRTMEWNERSAKEKIEEERRRSGKGGKFMQKLQEAIDANRKAHQK